MPRASQMTKAYYWKSQVWGAAYFFTALYYIYKRNHSRLQHQIAPDTTVDITCNGRNGRIDLFSPPRVVTVSLTHGPVLCRSPSDTVGQRRYLIQLAD